SRPARPSSLCFHEVVVGVAMVAPSFSLSRRVIAAACCALTLAACGPLVKPKVYLVVPTPNLNTARGSTAASTVSPADAGSSSTTDSTQFDWSNNADPPPSQNGLTPQENALLNAYGIQTAK